MGTPVSTRPAVRDAIARGADPSAARVLFERIADADRVAVEQFAADPRARAAVVAIAGASRSLSNGLVHDPTMLLALDEETLGNEATVAGLHHRLVALRSSLGHVDRALRVWKRREIFRIAVRDLLGLASMPEVGRELTSMATVALSFAVDDAAPAFPFAVVAMGKLGGAELNYASDIDVMFVHDGPTEGAELVARKVLSLMAKPTGDGIVFRTDANLRPEGRNGLLSRGLDGYRVYYERWAKTWEFQALLKARPLAGDAALGAEFMDLTRPLVWPEVLAPEAIREIRAMKERTETQLANRGLSERELKRGPGGIRDIEFAVQILQLVHGRTDLTIRSANTLTALHALANAGYIETNTALDLDTAYTFLRNVEHCLQLHDEQQTHTLPADRVARIRLARVLGYRDGPKASALEQFDQEYRGQKQTVRRHHEAMFFAPLLDALAGHGPFPPGALEDRLRAFGFTDARQTRAALTELTRGLTRRSRVMQQLLPVLLDWVSETPDPDLGLLGLRRLAEGPQRSMELARQFRESPLAAERVCRLVGSSRIVGDALRREPQFIEVLANEDLGAPEPQAIVQEAHEAIAWRDAGPARLDGIRRFHRRRFLHAASRELLSHGSSEDLATEWSAVAAGLLDATLASIAAPFPFAVIGLGRLGGAELGFASDLDVVFVYDGDGAERATHAERIAAALIHDISAVTDEGRTFVVDPALRPGGRAGALARSLDGYQRHYAQWADTWELQALLRARPVAGDPALAAAYMAMTEPYVYARDRDVAQATREIRRMKARIERERIPPGEDARFHLKLGPGTLSDVEWTVQLLQFLHARDEPTLRTASTLDALKHLVAADLLHPVDAETLTSSYRFCQRARDLGFLLKGAPLDSFPIDGAIAARLGVLMGYVERPRASLRDDYRRLTRRARRVFERLFYERA